jgi:hypothetical protein
MYYVLAQSQPQADEDTCQEVELFIEAENLLIGDERQSEKMLSINSMLVREGFAERTCPLTTVPVTGSGCPVSVQPDDFCNISILKAHLRNKCTDRASSKLLEELFDTAVDNDHSAHSKSSPGTQGSRSAAKDSDCSKRINYSSDKLNILVEGIKVSMINSPCLRVA